MKKLLLIVTTMCCINAAIATTARVQVIHNCADLAADSVDVYINSIKILDNFPFRTATPFITITTGVTDVIGIAPKGSASVADTIYSTTVTLVSGQKYIFVANGIVSPTGYIPGSATVPFRLSVYPMAHEVADTAGRTDVMVVHGSTDAPTVDVRAGASVLVNDISFGQFNSAGYLSLPTANYTIDVTNSTGTTTVQRYSAPLSTLGLTDSAITVLASGFLDSTVNSNGRKFGLWVALRKGGALIPLPAISTGSVSSLGQQVDIVIFPNPATNTVNINAISGNYRTIDLLDLNGKLINSASNVNKVSFNTTALPQGFYLVKLIDNNGIITVKQFTKN